MEQQDSASKLNEPIFSRKKSLLTVGQYAARQGVSAGIVQECARLGVVQVRKHKDKTFIVDLPLDIYKIIKQQDSQSSEEVDVSSCANKITDLVTRIFQPDNESQLLPAEIERTQDKKNSRPNLFETKPVHAESSFPQPQHKEPDTIPNLKLFAEEKKRTAAGKNKNESAAGGFRIPLLRSITESIRAISVWKLSFAFVAAAFVVSICAYAWVNMNRKIQQEKLQQAYESINKLMTKYEDARQQARLYEFDMMNWRSEAERSKNAMMNSETELQNVRKSLYETRKDLETMQQYNTEAIKELNEKITKIRTHIPNTGEQTK
jgi:uncharacterized FlaG/YvyC family protein